MFYITEKNWNKILGYAEEAYETEKSEIGGMSVMVKDKDNDWELQDPVILKQEISAGNTILDKEALAVYYTKQAKKMGKQDFRFCWWHSHHTMSAFWSGTDITAINEYDDGDFSFALVVNLKGEYKFRVSVWQPVEAHEDVDLDIIRPSRCNKHMRKEVKALCEKQSSTYSWKKSGSTYNSYNYGNYGYRSKDQLPNSIDDARQERIPFRSAASDKMLFADIIEEIDDINSDAIEGAVEYKEYKIQVDNLNDKLKEENNMYRVVLIPENKLGDLLHMFPNQMVVYKDSEMQVYNDSYYGFY